MSKEELSSLREEIFKEIHNVENNMNLKVLKYFQENEDKNKIFVEKFTSLYHKSQTLSDSISSQVVNLDKIKEFDIFKNKIDNIIITHEIRINNNREDLKNMEFKYDKEILENLKVPGYVGPSCKFKNISNYISYNIDEVSKLKIENESFKKELKDIKKKLDEIIRTVLNLVDNTNIKMVQYVDTKSTILKQVLNEKINEMNDKILDFRSLLLTQKNAEDLQAHLIKEMQNNNYTKEEVDNKLADIVKNFGVNFDDFKVKCDNDYNILIKQSLEKFDKENNEINQSIKEIKNKIKQINEINMRLARMERMKTNIYSSKGNTNNIISQNSDKYNNVPRIKEEEKKIIYRNYGQRKSIDLTNDLRYINNIENKINELKRNQEKKNSIRSNNGNTNINDKNQTISSENSPKFRATKNKFLSNSSIINIKEKNEKDLICLNTDENKKTISNDDSDNENQNEKRNVIEDLNIIEKFNISVHPNIASNNKIETIEKENNHNNSINNNVFSPTPNNSKSKFFIHNKINKSENKNRRNLLILKNNNKKTKSNESKNNRDIKEDIHNMKLQNNNSSKSNKNVSDLLSFGMNNQNQKSILISLENEKTHKYNNSNPIVEAMKENNYIKSKINDDKINFINTKNIKPKKGLSIHQLANIGFEEREKKLFSSIGSLSPKSTSRKNMHNKTITPIIKNVFKQTFQINNKTIQNINSEVPIKINQAFGRTGYSYYDKKKEGINNLIDKGITNKMKNFNNNSSDIRFKLYPAAKIKVFSDI